MGFQVSGFEFRELGRAWVASYEREVGRGCALGEGWEVWKWFGGEGLGEEEFWRGGGFSVLRCAEVERWLDDGDGLWFWGDLFVVEGEGGIGGACDLEEAEGAGTGFEDVGEGGLVLEFD